MSSATTASDLASEWLDEVSAALRGRWQVAAAASHGEQRPRRQRKLGGGDLSEKNMKAVEGAAGAGKDAAEGGGAMSDATLCLLLDRFAPS